MLDILRLGLVAFVAALLMVMRWRWYAALLTATGLMLVFSGGLQAETLLIGGILAAVGYVGKGR